MQATRRQFIQSATAAAGAFAVGQVAPASAQGANERIRFGVVGCGNMGTGHVGSLVGKQEAENIQVVAVSDVYQRRLTRAIGVCNGDGYLDYRRLIEREDIDAVLIATPDHWHTKIAIEAMESGKDVYVEKPLSHTVEQALECRDAVRRTGRVLQVGPQGAGNDSFWKGHQAILEGRIGKPTWAHAAYNRNARVCLFNDHGKVDDTAGPDKTGEDFIDWNMWLGHEWGLAPQIEWTPDHFFRFRKYFAYNGGVATDLLYHKLAPMLLTVFGPNGAYPSRVNANGGQYIEKDGRDIPDTFLMTADYPQEFSMFLVSTLTNDAGFPDRVYGKYGTMELGGDPFLQGNGDMKPEFKEVNGGVEELRIPLEAKRDMEANFIDAIRGKGPTFCNVELGASTMVAIKLAVESYRQGKTMLWDAEKEEVKSA